MRMAYIGMGANLASYAGPPPDTLSAALVEMANLGRVVARSSLYRTDPVGFAHQPPFVNAVVVLETDLGPQDLLRQLFGIEKQFGRDRSAGLPNGPRALDLDILLMDDLAISESGLEIPHPRIAERAFVLIPLGEIAPNLRLPGHEKTVAELMQVFENRSEGGADGVERMESDRWWPALLA